MCCFGGVLSIRRNTSSGLCCCTGCSGFTGCLVAGMMVGLSPPASIGGKSLSAITIPESQAKALCSIVKTASPSEAWSQGEKIGAHQMSFGVVCAPPRRGLVVQIYINQGYKVLRRTMNFGLWDSESGILTRVYQLTVADSDSPSHKEHGILWHGSHQHMGAKATHRPDLDAIDFLNAMKLFCSTISLTLDEPIPDPFAFDLT